MALLRFSLASLACLAGLSGAALAQDVEVISNAGSLTKDPAGNAYSAGFDGVYQVAPDGQTTLILDAAQEPLYDRGDGVLVDSSGTLFTVDRTQDHVLRVTSSGVATILIDSAGDGVTPLTDPRNLALDPAGNLYVSSKNSSDVHHVFRVTPAGVVSVVLDDTQMIPFAGVGLDAIAMAMDSAGNLFVGLKSHNAVVKRALDGTLTQVMDVTGDGAGNPLHNMNGLRTDRDDNLFVVGQGSDNVFRVTPQGAITEIIDRSGDGAGNLLINPFDVDIDVYGNAFVTGIFSDNAFKVAPSGLVTQVLDSTGNGTGLVIDRPGSVIADGFGSVLINSNGNLVRLSTVAGSLVRNGSGVNPVGFTEVAPPILGSAWQTTVDVATPGAVLSAVDIVAGGPLAGVPLAIGELLCLPPSLASSVVAGPNHAFPLPANPALAGAQFCSQAVAVKLGPLELQLQNALDVTLGTF